MEIARERGTKKKGVEEHCSEGWLQVNLILDGSSSPLKYLVNRFRSSTYPRSLQTFDSLCFPRSRSRRLSAPRFHLSVLVSRSLCRLAFTSLTAPCVSEARSRQNEGLFDSIGLVFKSIPIHSPRFVAAGRIDLLKQSLPIRARRSRHRQIFRVRPARETATISFAWTKNYSE